MYTDIDFSVNVKIITKVFLTHYMNSKWRVMFIPIYASVKKDIKLPRTDKIHRNPTTCIIQIKTKYLPRN